MAPPAPAKNGLITASGYGSIGIQVTKIDLGISIISNESTTRRYRTIYPWKRTSSSFNLEVTHRSMEDFRAFNDWMRVYVEAITNPDNNRVGPMRVIVSVRKFDRFCIPEGTFPFGQAAASENVRRQDLSFVGASDPMQPQNLALGRQSTAYLSTYHTEDGKSGDYLSNYAIASMHDAIMGGADFEDMLYNPTIGPKIGNPTSPGDFLPGQGGRRGMPL